MTTRVRRAAGTAAAYAVLTGASVIALFPIFWTVSTSLKRRVDSFAIPPRFFDFHPTLRNYASLFSTPEFVRVLGVTVLVTAASTLLCVGIGTLAGYALARHTRFPGRRPLEVSLILVRALPGIVLMVPLYQIVLRLGLYDRIEAVVVAYAAVNLPFATWLMASFVEQIPAELEESASLDGAGRFQILARVVVPLILPGMSATMIFVALLAWNEFLIPVVIADTTAKTLPVLIAGFISARTLDWGPMAAASSLAIVPIAVVTVLLQRRLVTGLGQGAIRG